MPDEDFAGEGEPDALCRGVWLGSGVSSGFSSSAFAFVLDLADEAEGEGDGDSFGVAFFFGEADGVGVGEALCRLCGVGVGEAKIFFNLFPNESFSAASAGPAPARDSSVDRTMAQIPGLIASLVSGSDVLKDRFIQSNPGVQVLQREIFVR